MNNAVLSLALPALVMSLAGSPACGQTLTDLDTFMPRAASADGRVLGGICALASQPCRWIVGLGAESLPVLPGTTFADVWSASADGSVLVGRAGPNQFDTRAMRWADGSVSDLGALPGTVSSFAQAVSADGSVVVGRSFTVGSPTSERPFVWTVSGGMQPLPLLPGWDYARAQAITPDGSVIAGKAAVGPAVHLVLWTASGAELLEQVTGGIYATTSVVHVSADGNVLAGHSDGRIFRRTPGAGVVDLGQHNGTSSVATGMSGDGSIIVGYGQQVSGPPGSAAFVWTEGTGIIPLSQYLSALGVGGPLLNLSEARAITPDGRTISGASHYELVPPGTPPTRGWFVTIPDPCYPNCDHSTAAPVLNIADFSCFLLRFAQGDGWANCDKSSQPPTLNIADFACFLQRFAAGCR